MSWCSRCQLTTLFANIILILAALLWDTAAIIPAAAAKLLQSCPTLCDPRDGSPSGSPVPGILQARTLEWVAISFSNAWKWKVKVKSLSHLRLFATPWTAAYQAPPSMGFSRQEHWSGVPLPSLHKRHKKQSKLKLSVWDLANRTITHRSPEFSLEILDPAGVS